jgi:ECF sigma factor
MSRWMTRLWWAGSEKESQSRSMTRCGRCLASMREKPAWWNRSRFFGGFSVEESAEVLKVLPVTVMRDSTARAWLYRRLTRGATNGSETMDAD